MKIRKIVIIIIVFLLGFTISGFDILYASAQSVYDGTWTIIYTGCTGVTTKYEGCKVLDFGDTFLTFTSGRRLEIKLPVISGCSNLLMLRER